MSLASEKVRISFKLGDDIRDAGLKTPDDIQRFDDIVYGPDPKMQSLDVYRPKGNDAVLPVIVSVHGGGWVYGDKERYQYYCMSLAQRGFAVVNFTYRLAPEAKFPACVEDTCTVFQWVLDHAAEYKMDPRHVFAVGDSAGAHILGLFCHLCTNPKYAARYSFSAPKGFVPTAVALNCGHYTYQNDRSESTFSLMEDLLGCKPTDEKLEPLDVIRYLTPKFPPSFIMTATGDFLAVQAPVLSAAMMEKKIPHELHYYASESGKDLGHVFHCNMRCPEGSVCNEDECSWFRKFC